ncbi:hypothetical protein KY349_01970 [Candidatus Woesearchaeota archaeon]|nr:hypothetical protein [Candidatus Woesearchaeota archaeon]
MRRRAKNDNPIALYRIFSDYPNFPQSTEEQRRLVGMVYDQLKAPDGRVRTDDAKDGRVFHVARNLFGKAHDAYHALTRQEHFILKHLLRIYKAKKNAQYPRLTPEQRDMAEAEKEAKIERLCIQIEELPDSDISERVEKVAVQVLGHMLCVGDRAQPHGVSF